MLASLYNGNVHVWNHETQVSVAVGAEGRGGRGDLCVHPSVCRRWSSHSRSRMCLSELLALLFARAGL